MTISRYLDESAARLFTANVTRVVDDRVVLDETLFYPTGGGQPNDTGILDADGDTWRVVDVTKTDTIYHHLDGNPPAEGTIVTGTIDWDRRERLMRYHTAQHVLSAYLLDAYDAPTVGNQIALEYARIDVAHDRFSDSDLADIEGAVNDVVDANLSVSWYTMDRGVAESELDPERTRLDLLPDSITEVRIVEIGDEPVLDRTACAGTHVASTGEIGGVTVTGRTTKGSGKERVRFELD